MHLTRAGPSSPGEPVAEKRNVLVESARIARGEIRDVAGAHADEIDALILPGGFGAALNSIAHVADGIEKAVRRTVELID